MGDQVFLFFTLIPIVVVVVAMAIANMKDTKKVPVKKNRR